MIKISLTQLRQVASGRPEGYFEEVTAAGTITGKLLLLDDKVYAELCKKYKPANEPGLVKKAVNLSGAIKRVTKAAVKREQIAVSPEEQQRRLEICRTCPFFNGTNCQKCGCFVRFKTRLATEHCPIQKW